ncbi:MAG: hypothetical protein OXO52_22250 [Rhodospirillales bacterium]|nr:hypothetical protein [Rhodospirillales bacterium]MDE0380756.1 hypothetical protein [Rhodospirillales bacterium]
MPSPKATVTQSELTRYAKALRAAGYDDWRIEVAKPDGTKVSICAGKGGEAANHGDDIDRMIEKLP